MSSKRLVSTEGVIVRRRDQGEADRILTLCTPGGKIEVIAKGVRKTRSRKAGHLELFSLVHLVLAHSRASWDVVSQADLVEPHAEIRDDLVLGSYARYMVELYDRFVTEDEGGAALFDLLVRALGYLCQGEQLELLMRAYEQRLLTLVGFRPELYRCVGERDGQSCGRELELTGEAPLGFDPEKGGGLCPECYHAARDAWGVIALSPRGLHLLRALRRESFAQLRERGIAYENLQELERVARHYITYHLERDVRSGAFLRRLKRTGEVPAL